MQAYQQKIQEALDQQGVNQKAGLSDQEIINRQAKFGKNAYEKPKKRSLILQILAQFKDVSTIILLIAGILSLVLAIVEGGSVFEAIVVFAIIIMNVTLAITQERGAEKSLEALSSLSAPSCKVIRNGETVEIEAADLVPGDIVLLKTGDLVPADARLISSEQLTVDESSLTGESEPSEKNSSAEFDGEVALGDRANMVFSGCLVTGGNAKAVVIATGMDTQLGKIAGFLKDAKQHKTPLQARLDKVGKIISGIAIMSAIILFAIGLLQKHGVMEMMLIAVTLAVAAVPETLSLIVTLTLTNGVKKMVSKNALIRQLQSVETLGNTSIICSDKTGTLTMNKMAVRRLWLLDKEHVSADDELSIEYTEFLEKMCCACTASVGIDDNGNQRIIGDPTETAIVRLSLQKDIDYEQLKNTYQKVAEIPFSSERKMMTVVVKCPTGGYTVLTKGAFDRLPFKKNDLNHFKRLCDTHDAFADDALRIITLATKHIDELPKKLESLEKDLDFAGFIGIIDPPRPEAALAIKKARSAGIRTIMITGDHALTAKAIARELGIIAASEGVLTGQELAAMSDEQLDATVEFYSVYARVSPEDKIRIVRAWQQRGEVVAMTGDGVNDAPALKAADVGVAMGINGTEVSKAAAKMILMDDKFSTIIEAVGEGRNIFSNIRKLIYFLFVCNISEILVMLFAQFLGWELPLTAIMLLLINVVGDGIPGMALAKEQSDARIMTRKPIGRSESFFGGGLMEVIIRQTFVFAAVSLAAFYIGSNLSLGSGEASVEAGRTMAFLVTGWTSILHVLTVRSRNNIYKYRLRDNPQLYISCLVMIVVFLMLALIPPVAGMFGLVSLSGMNWLVVIGLTLVPTIVAEYGKLWDAIKFRSIEKNRIKM